MCRFLFLRHDLGTVAVGKPGNGWLMSALPRKATNQKRIFAPHSITFVSSSDKQRRDRCMI